MPSLIRPNRQEVSDHFPMLGFTIRTDGESKRYEVAIANDAALFQSDAKPRRTPSNFYSSRAVGLQPIDRGEAVYVLPPDVLSRFVGNEKLFYALATYSNGDSAAPELSSLPSEASPYISLRSLSGRSLKRIGMLPNRQRSVSSYGGGNELEWAGDTVMPGTQTVAPAKPNGSNGNGNGQPSAPAAAASAFEYRDGFGPLPATRSRPVVKAQSSSSYSINWDDVELIPQPTGNTCWAAAGAMLIGWRDQICLTPDSLAEICGRSTTTNFIADNVRTFASELGLVAENPQSYTIEGFRSLLENYGPLWVSVDAPGGHAVVVTGIYSGGAVDGSDTYVRISDPWDRIVGTPGAPGAYLSTHNSGSRYIMSWADFTSEYERLASSAADG